MGYKFKYDIESGSYVKFIILHLLFLCLEYILVALFC